MGKAKVTLYVDILSPFAYLGYWLTRNSRAFSSVDVTYVPIHLGGLMQTAGNTPPLAVKNKDKWIQTERKRWAKNFNIPMSQAGPQPFPQSTVNTQRALCYISLHHPQQLPTAIDALYKTFWVDAKPIGKVEVIKESLEPALGGELTGKVLEGVKSEDAKKALKENTEKSFAEGAFGLPWFVATNAEGKTEGFWGVDHMGQLLEFLGVETKGQEGFKSLL